MREYSFKRGFKPSEERLVEALRNNFDSFEKINERVEGKAKDEEKGGIKYIASIEDAEFELGLKEKKLFVVTKKAGTKEVLKRYTRFLESLTGYTAKERRKRMLKEMNSNRL
ncbi:MAG: DUF5611 family protein [Candidatus Thermoplasmatota archaeon]|nr:DUF5611 family protein [Candidatus Thermoplasmatota archaeon]